MEKSKRKRSNFTYNNYRQQQNKRRRQYVLETGVKGFFCTCNGKENECIRESYNILNYYADQLIGPEEGKDIEANKNDKESNDDIEEELSKEVNSLKEKNSATQRRFQAVETGANGCVFIKTTCSMGNRIISFSITNTMFGVMNEDPVQLARSVFEDVEKTKQQKGRFLLRLVPIEVTCKAYIEDIRKTADQLFNKHFKCDPSTFSVIFNKRNNNNVLRDEVIEALARIVTDKNSEHKADLKHPKLAIIVEVVKGICCMSVLSDYEKFKKYNIFELANPSRNQSNSGVKSEVKESKDDDGGGGDTNTKIVFKDDSEEEGEGSKCTSSDDKDAATENVEEKNEDRKEEAKDETAGEVTAAGSENTEKEAE